jgi:Chaperone of endosialidase
MPNTHGGPDRALEVQALTHDFLPAVILSATPPLVPVPPSLTLPAFATAGYVRDTPHLVYVTQPAAAVTLAGADGAYWLALHRNTTSAVSGWTRQPGTHYLWRPQATAPADPPGALLLAQVNVGGGVITATAPLNTAPTRVAFGGPLGALAFDAQFTWDATTHRLGVGTAEPRYALDVLGLGQVQHLGLNVAPDPLHALTAAGTCTIVGLVGIGGEPTYGLDVFATARFGGLVGIGIAPGTTPGYVHDVNGSQLIRTDLQVNGQARKFGTAWTDLSDARLKTDVQPIPGALAVVQRLRGVCYRWTEPAHAAALPGPQYGFLAQEVQPVVPQWVGTTPTGDQTLTLTGYEALLVEALKALARRVEALEAG